MTPRCENYMTSRWLAARGDHLRQSLMATPQIFVQADSDLMLARRITRDTKERGRSVDGILEQYVLPNDSPNAGSHARRYLRYVKPSYDNFVLPSSRHADIVRSCFNNQISYPADQRRLYPEKIIP